MPSSSTRYDSVPPSRDEFPPPPGLPSGVGVTMEQLDVRLTNVERLLIDIQASQAPKWLRMGGWTSIIGAVLGAAFRMAFFK